MNTIRNYILFASITSVFIYSQSAGDFRGITDETDLIRSAGIKSKTVWEYYYVPGYENAFRDSGFRSLNYIFDEFGRITEYTKYHVYAPLTTKEMYTYNSTGKISNITRLNSNGDVIEKIDNKYSKKGLLKKQIHSAYYNSVRVGVYFTINANVNESDLFSVIQDELQVEPKLESYMITVNITDDEELNRYVVIGDESEPSSMRFSWSQLSQESQKGLLSYEGPNRKENSYKSKFISEVSFKYDNNGNLKERSVYNTAGDLTGRETYSYNTKNQKTNYYKYGDNGKLGTMERYIYNDEGRLSESIGMEPSGKVAGKLIYLYSGDGNLNGKKWINADGNDNGEFKYYYDNNNLIKEEKKFSSENEPEYRLEYSYDDYGNILEITRFDVNNRREKLWKYIYLHN